MNFLQNKNDILFHDSEKITNEKIKQIKKQGGGIQVSSKQKNKEKFQLGKEKIPIGGRKVIPIKRKYYKWKKKTIPIRKRKIFQLQKGKYSNQ